MKKNSSNSAIMLIAAIIGALIGFVVFSKKAFEAGKILEWSISTPVLIGTYYFFFHSPWIAKITSSFNIIELLVFYLIPLTVFALYWAWVFSYKNISGKATSRINLNWLNEAWWRTLDGWEFEEEVARVFRAMGYKAKVTKKTGDGGVDIIMYKDKLKYIVQCKHYQDPIPVAFMRELNGLMDDFGADGAVMVASSGATKDARAFISNKPYFTLLTLEDIMKACNDLETTGMIAELIEKPVNKVPVYFPN